MSKKAKTRRKTVLGLGPVQRAVMRAQRPAKPTKRPAATEAAAKAKKRPLQALTLTEQRRIQNEKIKATHKVTDFYTVRVVSGGLPTLGKKKRK